MIILLGYKDNNRRALPTIIYAGERHSEMRAAIVDALDQPWARMEKLVNPRGQRVPFQKIKRELAAAKAAAIATDPPRELPVPASPPLDPMDPKPPGIADKFDNLPDTAKLTLPAALQQGGKKGARKSGSVRKLMPRPSPKK